MHSLILKEQSVMIGDFILLKMRNFEVSSSNKKIEKFWRILLGKKSLNNNKKRNTELASFIYTWSLLHLFPYGHQWLLSLTTKRITSTVWNNTF